MANFCLMIQYDGTRYNGWQRQGNTADTIQGKLEAILLQLYGEPVDLNGSGRTDAGVHALGNVAVFDTDARMPAEKFSYALNTRLPQDIRIQDSCEVPSDFHPRFQRTVKTKP